MAELDLDPFTDVLDVPMYVVTAAAGDDRAGCLVGFASQCSIHPARYMVWLSEANHTFKVALRATHLTVHVLRREQRELARWFGSQTGDRVDKFERVAWHESADGSPVLNEADVWFVGRIEERIAGGDHVGFLLTPTEQSPPAPQAPALLRLSDVKDFEPGHPA
ncbi:MULTISPECIES: flavin reductase family protein [unclassified Streptomyces]|uniref:flavin reductase family protein n=1 Tax=unclassified Streptomyces TaxID=2593676 RepID=UPI00109E5A31|nr:flavin reductase family protein [Streptomyces sp. A1136]THA50328.1 flavin reductase [Streptomyces sp. A1136]